MDVEEEAQTPGELRHIAAARDHRVDISEAVGERVRHFFDRRAAGVAHVRARNRNRIEARRHFVRVQDRIGDQTHGRPDRKDPRAARDVLFEDVVLDRAGQLVARDAVLVSARHVHRVDHRRRAVDRERRRNPAEVDPLKQQLHLGEIRQRHADLADFGARHRLVRVEAALGRQIERHRKPGLALLQQKTIAFVRFFRRAEAGVLPHRPEPAAVTVREDAAGERKFSWRPHAVAAFRIVWTDDDRHVQAGRRAVRMRHADRFVEFGCTCLHARLLLALRCIALRCMAYGLPVARPVTFPITLITYPGPSRRPRDDGPETSAPLPNAPAPSTWRRTPRVPRLAWHLAPHDDAMRRSASTRARHAARAR